MFEFSLIDHSMNTPARLGSKLDISPVLNEIYLSVFFFFVFFFSG